MNEEATIHLTSGGPVTGTLVGFDNIWLNVDTADGPEVICIYNIVRVARAPEASPLQFD